VPDVRPELTRRRAGVCLHLTSLPGPRGIGEIGGSAALDFMAWMQAHGLSVWQFLPPGPTGFGDSPYQPLSVFAGNPMLIDLDALVEWGLLDRDEADCRLDGARYAVDFQRVAASKGPVLALAAERFDAVRDTGLMQEFEAYCAASDEIWLDDFAAFTLLKAEHGQSAWPQWGGADSRHRAGLIADVAARQPIEWRRAKLIQFFFACQWQALRAEAARRDILLFGDVPIYMALDCAEAWAHPELLALDEEFQPLELAGVPPDYFSADGQLWGNPVYRWDIHARDGFAWWISRLKHALARADLVRLDHFRGFDEFWAVPRGAESARSGSWQRGPGRELFDALADSLGSVPFVAEDLGIITESVVALRKAYALPGMQVLQFMVDQADFDAASIDEDCVCYTGTHDNDTTVGWFAGSQGRLTDAALHSFQDQVAANVEGTRESVHKAMINLCFKTRARLAIAPMQDYLGLDSSARLNTPGTAGGNWRWRVDEAALARDDLDFIADGVNETGRS
jgi:4-alpha-glucanotransferase